MPIDQLFHDLDSEIVSLANEAPGMSVNERLNALVEIGYIVAAIDNRIDAMKNSTEANAAKVEVESYVKKANGIVDSNNERDILSRIIPAMRKISRKRM